MREISPEADFERMGMRGARRSCIIQPPASTRRPLWSPFTTHAGAQVTQGLPRAGPGETGKRLLLRSGTSRTEAQLCDDTEAAPKARSG